MIGKGCRYIFVLLLMFPYIVYSQTDKVTISGTIRDGSSKTVLPYVNIVLSNASDSVFITGTISDEQGHFILPDVQSGNYLLSFSYLSYQKKIIPVLAGTLNPFLDVGNIELIEDSKILTGVTVTGSNEGISEGMDKKTFRTDDNITQSGGSVLQAMQNLPGVTVQEGKVQLRGNENVIILIDGKQTAMTGFNGQTGLDNIPASSIERIEIINNPSAKYDANGNGGIINIIMKKNKKDGLSGKIGLAIGAGALWIKKENLPGIRPQYQFTPKVNPSLSISYRKNKVNLFMQADNLYTHTLNKNEFVTRTYDDGTVINQQLKRNRITNFFTAKGGLDWYINDKNSLTVSGLFGSEKIIDRGDQPFYNADMSQRTRLWQFLEDELKTTVVASALYQHKFRQPGHLLNVGFNYTYHRENEKYFFDNILPTYTGKDAFKLLSDEHVADFNIDYLRSFKHGRIEAGLKFRYREIPTDMQFFPGLNSPVDSNAGGWATYREMIPAAYANYIFENKKFEAEVGVRVEYVGVNYEVNPNHPTYESDGYDYVQPFPNARLAYKINDRNKLSIFYNRRVDRPNEVDIRIFPKYDDAEIIKVGNPGLRPQFTHSFELGYKTNWKSGYFYSAAYHRLSNGTITRISSIVPGSTLIYAIFQNVNRSYNTGLEIILSQDVTKWYSFNLNGNVYHNRIDAFTVQNLYPQPNTFSAPMQQIITGNVKLNNIFKLPKNIMIQLTGVYLAPDIIPQGKIDQRFSLDLGIKKSIQKGKGEIFLNATDLLNTMVIKKQVQGNGFRYTSADYYETQAIRVGYSYKFDRN